MRVIEILEAEGDIWKAVKVGKSVTVIHVQTGNVVPGTFSNPGEARKAAQELNKANVKANASANIASAVKSSGATMQPASGAKLNALQKIAKATQGTRFQKISNVAGIAGNAIANRSQTKADKKYLQTKAELDANKKPSWLAKARVGVLRIFQSTVLGRAVFSLIAVNEISYYLDGYLIEYQKAGCKSTDDVLWWRIQIADTLLGLIVGFLVAGVTTAASIAAISAMFGAIPVAGWIVATLGIISGGVLSYFISKLARNTELMQSCANYIAFTMLAPSVLNKMVSPHCEGINESVLKETLINEHALYEKSIKGVKNDIKRASMKMIAGDPKLQKIIKFATKKDPEADPRN